MKKLISLSVLMLVLSAFAGVGFAGMITFNYTETFSNTTVPGGTSPYLVATFEDVSSGVVKLTLSASGLASTEFVDAGATYNNKGWLFNFNPDKTLSALTFTFKSGQVAAGITTELNAYRADGDGYYDIFFGFATSGDGRLTAGETSVYEISATGLTANDFYFLSAPASGGSGPFYSAAHIQGIATGEGSTWVRPGTSVPEPSTLLLLSAGILAAGLYRKIRV